MIKKLIRLSKLKKYLRKNNKNKKIAFANGCFDILHTGHIQLLINSKKRCDILIVGLNSDHSYFKLKKKVPYFSFNQRANILSQIDSVDFILELKENNPIKILNILRPNLHCKGGDYKKKELKEYGLLKKLGIKIYLMPIKKKKISSSKLLNKFF